MNNFWQLQTVRTDTIMLHFHPESIHVVRFLAPCKFFGHMDHLCLYSTNLELYTRNIGTGSGHPHLRFSGHFTFELNCPQFTCGPVNRSIISAKVDVAHPTRTNQKRKPTFTKLTGLPRDSLTVFVKSWFLHRLNCCWVKLPFASHPRIFDCSTG